MPTIQVLDAAATQQSAALVPNTGRATETNSLPVLFADPTLIIGTGTTTFTNVLTGDGSPTNAAAYQSGVMQVVSTASSGTYIAEQSVDGNSWVACPLYEASSATPTPLVAAITATVATRIFRFAITGSFFRIRVATGLNNSGATFTVAFSFMPFASTVQFVGGISAGTAAIGDVGVQYRANATGAASGANVLCPATPAVQVIKASAGRLLSITLTNSAASTRWLKLWNTASGSITLGTTAALYEIAIPPARTISFGLSGGIGFSTAICAAITGGQGLTNNAAVTLGDVTGIATFA